MEITSSIWPKKITVDKRIISILSGSTYNNFPKALKEIIINSYDADAIEVKLTINENDETITIEDNGIGLSEGDFDFYLRIAGKDRKTNEYTLNRRRRIGQFGVGFLSVFPFCRSYNIESTKKGSPEIIFATIPNQKFVDENQKINSEIEEIPIQGGKKINSSLINTQFTKIKLIGFTKLAKDFFKHAYIITGRRETILNFEPLKRLEWELCEDLPIEYDIVEKEYEKFQSNLKYPFRVYFNSDKKFLVRNIHARNILETHNGEYDQIGKIKFKYFIATDYKTVKPVEARQLKLRNYDVGVGSRTSFGIGLEGRTYARLAHITGEIQFIDGMNDFINVARDDFNFSPDFEQLKEYFRIKLRKWCNELDRLNEDEKFITATEDKRPIKDLSVLVTSNITKKLDDLEKRGFKIKQTEKIISSTTPIMNKISKEIIIPRNIEKEEEIIKTIEINKKFYKLKLSSWEFKEENPACRLKDNIILINEDYPLFKNKRYLDIFIKIHSILLLKVKKGIITQSAYNEIVKDISNTFSEY